MISTAFCTSSLGGSQSRQAEHDRRLLIFSGRRMRVSTPGALDVAHPGVSHEVVRGTVGHRGRDQVTGTR